MQPESTQRTEDAWLSDRFEVYKKHMRERHSKLKDPGAEREGRNLLTPITDQLGTVQTESTGREESFHRYND